MCTTTKAPALDGAVPALRNVYVARCPGCKLDNPWASCGCSDHAQSRCLLIYPLHTGCAWASPKEVQRSRNSGNRDQSMPSPSDSQPLLSNGQLPTSSGAAHDGEAVGSATETPSKPFSQRLQRLRGRLDSLQHSCFGGLRSSCAAPTSETYVGIALCAGIVCGGVAFLYSSAFEALLDLVWTKVPENLLLPWCGNASTAAMASA